MKRLFQTLLIIAFTIGLGHAQQLGTGIDLKNGKSTEGSDLEVTDFAGTLILNTHPDNAIFLKASGDDTVLSKLRIIRRGTTIEVLCTDPKNTSPMTVEIYTPEMMKIDVIMARGEARIGSRRGAAVLDVTGHAIIRLDNLDGNLSSTLRGDGLISVKNLTGNARLETHGSGTIEILKGSLETLAARVLGDGKINCQCFISRAMQAEVLGSGLITVLKNMGQSKIIVQGKGEVKLLQPQMDYLSAKVQGSGAINAHGSALGADLETHGQGTIGVERITGEFKQRVLGSGSIRVNESLPNPPAIVEEKKEKIATLVRKRGKIKKNYKEKRRRGQK